MADRFSSAQKSVIDRDNRNMSAGGIAMGDELNDIWAAIDSGSIGITAEAKSIDSLAGNGGNFAHDPDTTSGLVFGYKAGRAVFAGSVVEVSAGTVTLSASNVNYVEVNSAGTVSKNTVGWTAGSARLWKITTGTSTISTIENAKVLMSTIQSGAVTGSLLSTAAATKEIAIDLGSISATSSFCVIVPNVAGVVTGARFACATDVAANDTDYWTFGLVNKGPAGTGTTKIVDSTAAANSTKATGGSAISDYVKRSLTIDTANDDVAAGDVLELTITKAASATTMAQATLLLEISFVA
jgi:hypothetical protein